MPLFGRRDFNALLLASAGSTVIPSCASAIQGTAAFDAGVAMISFAQFPSLQNEGGSAVVNVPGRFPIVVVRVSAQSAVALSATCTHQFCTMAYSAQAKTIHCPCHNANFALDGSVLSGPTSIPIPGYAATLVAGGIDVQIDADQ